jgi:hypothetical protein
MNIDLAVLLWLPLPLLLAARLFWQRRPNFLTCALFWALALVLILTTWSTTVSQFFFLIGIALNAVVTLANGGFMPVAVRGRGRGQPRSLWVQQESGQRLLILADNFGNRFIRFSVGDAFLAVGLVLSLAGF